jgi:hypothetical protein
MLYQHSTEVTLFVMQFCGQRSGRLHAINWGKRMKVSGCYLLSDLLQEYGPN